MNGNRVCGECVACCVYLRIEAPELTKKTMQHCPHLRLSEPVRDNVAQYSTDKEHPCSIYDGNRPEVCRGYQCCWRQGHGAECDRPDRSGMLIDTIHLIDNGIECKPLGPGFENEERAIAAVHRISHSTGCVALVTNFYEKQFVRIVGRPLLERDKHCEQCKFSQNLNVDRVICRHHGLEMPRQASCEEYDPR